MRYLLLAILLLVSGQAFGATQLKTTVCPSGCDYTTLESAVNANEQNLVTADKYLDVEISGTWSSADTTSVTVHNYTTDATRYVNIYTTGDARHRGVYSTGYYALVGAVDNNAMLTIDSSYITITGLQIYNTQVSPTLAASALRVAPASIKNGILIDRCILIGGRFTFRSGVSVTTILSSIIYGGTVGGAATTDDPNANLSLKNCTIIGGSTYGVYRSVGTLAATNCYASSSGGSAYSSVSLTTSASDDATGTVGLQNINDSTTSGAYFTNVTSGAEDFHIGTLSSLIGAGTDLSGTFTTDIDGTTRTGTWDIGADEYVATASAGGKSILRNSIIRNSIIR